MALGGGAKGGPRLKESAGPPAESERNQTVKGRVDLQTQKDGFPELFPKSNMGGTFKDFTVRIRFRDYPLSDLVQQFSFALGAHVIDRTGLTGKHDFTLEFTLPENGPRVRGAAVADGSSEQQCTQRRSGGFRIRCLLSDGTAARAQAGSNQDRDRYSGDRFCGEDADRKLK